MSHNQFDEAFHVFQPNGVTEIDVFKPDTGCQIYNLPIHWAPAFFPSLFATDFNFLLGSTRLIHHCIPFFTSCLTKQEKIDLLKDGYFKAGFPFKRSSVRF